MEVSNGLNLMFLNLYKMYRICKARHQQRRRRWKVRPINNDWATRGYFRQVFAKIKDMDEEQFFLHSRMPKHAFYALLDLVHNELFNPKHRICLEERLSLTLLYLAHGTSIQSIACRYKIGKTTARNIILETCDALWRVLSPIYVTEPSENQYKDIARDFNNMWHMPNCVGAIEGKHIAIKCPSNSGSHNYKKNFSIVLMAACDAKYKFTAVSLGSYGSQSDGGVFRTSKFGQDLMANTLPLPPPAPLPNAPEMSFSHFFVADAAFPLRNNLMRPYPGLHLDRMKRIYNYRLSRARRTIENTFGVLTARWRILRNTIECHPENCESIVLACIALHNYLMTIDEQRWYCPENYVDHEGVDNTIQQGDWRRDTSGIPFRTITSYIRRSPKSAVELRYKLAKYFINEGAVPFQDGMI